MDMMTVTEFALAICVLLITPGPTNTLLFLAGSERGLLGGLRCVPAEVAGYLTTVVPLMVIGTTLIARYPEARQIIALAAGVWVAWLAFGLWRLPKAGEAHARVTARMVYVTTVLNPKALIFGLVLLPSATHAVQNIAMFVAQVFVIGGAWATFGASFARKDQGQSAALPLIRRIAAVWLAAVSVTLIARGVGAWPA